MCFNKEDKSRRKAQDTHTKKQNKTNLWECGIQQKLYYKLAEEYGKRIHETGKRTNFTKRKSE